VRASRVKIDHEFVRASRGARTFPGVVEENYWFRRHEAAYGMAARSLRAGPEARVLDVGCGEGYGAAILRAAGASLDAVELDAGAAGHAARTYPGIRVVRADACSLPCRAGVFDAIVALQVLEHLFCADGFLRQARELLRPGGTLVLSTPNRETFSPDGEPNDFHVYEYTAEELEAILRVHFDDVTVGGLHHGSKLAALERLTRTPIQQRLMRTPYPELPRSLRLALRSVWARDFRAGRAEGSLDLLATGYSAA
jgi:2-polyprenyl-3-methyl-5-hydroxy-6-metoxy-1,4-benzoquinol methylase